MVSNLCTRAINLVAGSTQGFSGDGGPATSAQLANPQDMAVDASGNVSIADTGSACIRQVRSGTVSHFAGGGANTACSFSGAATAVSLNAPGGVGVDSSGRVVIGETSRRCARIVDAGTVSQLAGATTARPSRRGSPPRATSPRTPRATSGSPTR